MSLHRRDRRAVSPVVGTVLLVAVTVVIAATVAAFGLGFTDRLHRPAPDVSQSSGRLVHDVAGGGDQVVKLTLVAGDTLDVSNLEVVVDATDACGKRARIVDLPTTTLGSDHVEGDDIFDYYSPSGGQFDTSADGSWSAGETARFRLASSECSLSPGDRVHVRVVHEPSHATVISHTLTAR